MEKITVGQILVSPLILVVRVYQKTLSPDHGPMRMLFPYGYCKYYPSCSEYTALSLKKYGLKGIIKSIKRIISCTPSSHGGVDLP